ncbi:hypothetical protein Dimus_033557 [Dionaea muscipula]
MGDSSSGDENGDEGGRFPGLFDSIEGRRLRFGEMASFWVTGGRPVSELCLSVMSPVPSTAGGDGGSRVVLQRDGGASGDGFFGDSPKMVVDVLMDGLGRSPVAGGVAVHGMDGADAPVSGDGFALVADGAPLACNTSFSGGIEIPVQTSPCVAVDPIHSNGPAFCPLPVHSIAHGVSSFSISTVPVTVNMKAVVPVVPASGHASGPIPAGRKTATRPAGGSSSSRPVVDAAMPVLASGSRLAYARVYVEIDASEDFIYEIPVTLGPSSCLVRLRYPWLPPRCGVCLAFGHETSSCASLRSTVPDACVPTTSLHGGSQPSAHAMPGSTLRPHAGVRGTPPPSSGSGRQHLAPQGSERTEVGRGLDGRGRTPDRTGRVSRERSVPRHLRPVRPRSLSSDLSPPGTGRDPVRSPERSSDGFVAVRTKPPSKRGGRGRGRRGS